MKKTQSGIKRFSQLCLNSQDENLFSELLNLFLTEEEKSDLGKRYLIIEALIKNAKTQREIGKDLNVSIAKITRGSNELKRIHPKLLNYLKKHYEN